MESNIRCPTILIAWFKFLSESINYIKVTFSLISFRISKSSLFFHIVRLYPRFCSNFIFLLFDIIALSKWIIFLQFSFCRVNNSSTLFKRALKDLLSPIQWKYDAKILKQQLLDVFWWYFTTGAAGWNYIFFVIFALPIGTPNIWNFLYHRP